MVSARWPAERVAGEIELEELKLGVSRRIRRALEAALPHAVYHRVDDLQTEAQEDRVEGQHGGLRIHGLNISSMRSLNASSKLSHTF